MKRKKHLAHHRVLASGGRIATRERVRPYMTAHAPVEPSPRPCAFRLLAHGTRYLMTVVVR